MLTAGFTSFWDLTYPDVWHYLRDRVDGVLSTQVIDTSSGTTTGTRSRQEAPDTAVLPRLTPRTPRATPCWTTSVAGTPMWRGSPVPPVAAASTLGVIERVQRFWISDMADAIARQHIHRWTEQLVAPEYLGAHISARRPHQTGRTLSLDFRGATAFFLAFGIEWDLTKATPTELQRRLAS